MTNDETIEFLLGVLAVHWPGYKPPADEPTMRAAIRVWQDALSDIQQPVAERAVKRLGRRDFPPAPMQVRHAALELMGVDFGPSPATALDEAFRALNEYDPEGFNNRPLWVWSHPSIKRAVDAMGGLRGLYGDLGTVRAQFLKAYAEIHEEGIDERLHDPTLPQLEQGRRALGS